MGAKPRSVTNKGSSGTGTVATQRVILCVSVAALTYWCTSGALFVHVPEIQRAVLVGLAAGLIGNMWVAAGGATGISLLGLAVGPANFWGMGSAPLSAVALSGVAIAGVVAVGAVLLGRYVPTSSQWVFWAAVVLIIVNMWVTVIEVDTTPIFDVNAGKEYSTVYQSLQGDVNVPNEGSDERLFVWVVGKMRSGIGYYRAFADARPTITPGANGPTSIFNFREPMLYVLIAAAPGAWLVIGMQLVLASVAALGLIWVLRDYVKLPVVLPGIAAVATLSAMLLTILPLYAEVWTGLLCLIAVEFAVMSSRVENWQVLVISSAAVALCAFLIREFAVFLLVGGLVSAWVEEKSQRSFRLSVWAGALIAAVVGYGAHAAVALRHVVPYDPAKLHEGFAWLHGSLAFALSGLAHGHQALEFTTGPAIALSTLIALLGIVGLYLLPARGPQVMAAVLVGSLLLVGLLAGDGSQTKAGVMTNYWGITSQFIVYGCIPLVFALIPAARVRKFVSNKGSR
jgi:hypothetical protein